MCVYVKLLLMTCNFMLLVKLGDNIVILCPKKKPEEFNEILNIYKKIKDTYIMHLL